MITGERMAMVDRNAAALGVARKQLMESSGGAVAGAVRERAEPGAGVTLVCGRGNNGGDAFVAARFLEAYGLRVVLLGRPETITTRIARENWEALRAAEVPTETCTDSADFDLGDPDVVVDAMLGTGVSGALREPEATAAAAIDDADATVVSVDVPSGFDADADGAADDAHESPGDAADDTGDDAAAAPVDADVVVTFHDEKPGLADLDAEVTVADIGIPDGAELFVGPGDLRPLARDPESHKGDHGEVLVVGGGPYTGAPTLAARAALRAGADLVRVACPESIAREVQGFDEGLIVRPLPGDRLDAAHLDRLRSLAAEHDAVVLGPGLGDADETLEAVGEFLGGYDGTAVVDADALQVVPRVDTAATLICTPHQGELRGMGGETAADWRERADLVAEFAADLGQVLLVKGAYDVVSDGETTRVGRTGNPGMTVGGTGDVLAGVTGALASTQEPVHAAAVAAYANGRAGDMAVEENGYGLVATDLLDRIPHALRDEGGDE
ncbi:NAD(P)H-hydrate dehydratase [Halorarum salinum]|uniref:Bifunctional NAD(P)H-hydrate repair enzyme n=1 Tax=Halorarum salinum TaxID=2743089 RepID=A0A7D5LA06_9EURY|nr:NAD(P)H-hydrate dehydratase [Halobaculum salinum]QLG61826.1 NAD(P)H-hydrate dehydratase [Halobaculum salinum]